MLLAHTDFLLSEYPHAVAIGVFVWWLDRISADGTLLQASTRRLVVLGVLAAVAYNVRRESIVLVVVLAITQLRAVARRPPRAARAHGSGWRPVLAAVRRRSSPSSSASSCCCRRC